MDFWKSSLNSRSLIHFNLTFIESSRYGPSCIFFMYCSCFFHMNGWKDSLCSISCAQLKKSNNNFLLKILRNSTVSTYRCGVWVLVRVEFLTIILISVFVIYLFRFSSFSLGDYMVLETHPFLLCSPVYPHRIIYNNLL